MPRIVTTNALPAGSILLHIGAHKTGTTSIQVALHEARDALTKQGVYNLVPIGYESANIAARAVQRLPASGTSGSPVDYKIWELLAESASNARGSRVAISAEAFAVSEPSVISTIVRDLGKEHLYVVVTLRPLAKILPSQWQQDLHGAWQSQAFDPWLEDVLRDPRPSRRVGLFDIPHPFWFRHRHDHLVRRWTDALGPERITLIVVDDQRKESLFETFEQLLGVRDGTLPRGVSSRNRSMTLQEMLIMQRYGELLQSTDLGKRIVEHARYHRALRILRKIRPESTQDVRLQIPSWSHARVGEIQEEMRTQLEVLKTNIIGSLSDLTWLPRLDVVDPNEVPLVAESELERIAQRMLKSAARRVGIKQSESSVAILAPARLLGRSLSRLTHGVERLIRLGARFIRIRF